MWTSSGPGRDSLLLLATDATAAGYSKHRQGGTEDKYSKQIDWVRPDLKTNMEVRGQTTRGSFRGKGFFL